MNAARQLAEIYAKQAERLDGAAIVVSVGGGLGTASLYAVVTTLRTRAEAAAARHRAAADEDEPLSEER